MKEGARLLVFGAACAASLGVCSAAYAAAPGSGSSFDSASANYEPPKTVRRGGFAMGMTSSYGVGEYRGYELSFAALNDPDGLQTTHTAFTTNFNFWLGVSPRDWLTAGVGFSALSAQGQSRGVNAGILFHVEAFPFFYKGGFYQDLGVAFDGGLSMGMLAASDDKKFADPIAEGGAMSTLGFSTFWEPLRFWHFSAGPAVTYTHAFSQTMTINQVTLGFRAALYGVQPKKQPKATEQAATSSVRGGM